MRTYIYVPDYPGSKGFAFFCRLGDEGGWESSLRFIEGAGFRLSAPNNRDIVITVEPIGDRVERLIADFRKLAGTGVPLILRIWTEEGDDMLCEFRREDSIEIYWFGQLEKADERFVSALLERFGEAVKTGTATIIVDWHAGSENFDWVGFLNERVGYSGVPPEVFGLPSAFSGLTHLDLRGFSKTERDGHVLYARNTPPVCPPEPPEEVAPFKRANPDDVC